MRGKTIRYLDERPKPMMLYGHSINNWPAERLLLVVAGPWLIHYIASKLTLDAI